MKIRARFQGKVIVPAEPLDLRPNQALIVHIETLEGEPGESVLAWITANALESDALPADLADQHDHYLYGGPKKRRGAVSGPTEISSTLPVLRSNPAPMAWIDED